MALLDLFKTKEIIEERAELTNEGLLSMLSNGDNETFTVTRSTALEIPAVQACLDILSYAISSLPVKLYYTDAYGKVNEVCDDIRIKILNSDTRSTMTSTQMWKAVITDYFLGKGAHIYINKKRNKCISLHYVKDTDVSFMKNTDPIFVDYDILIMGNRYKPSDFVKILRHTDDGIEGKSICDEIQTALSIAYGIMVFEERLVRRGGSKKGILNLNDSHIGSDAMKALKDAVEAVFSTSKNNVAVINKGADFKELSNTSVEMQMNETKASSDSDICKVFGVPESIIKGNATTSDMKLLVRTISGIISDIESSLDRDLLLESEKDKGYYFAFDTKELNRGDIKERFEAYKTAIDSNILGIDEVREMEDLQPLGINWITLGLDSVLYNPKTGDVYTPNTNATANMNNTEEKIEEMNDLDNGGGIDESGDKG